MGRKNGCTELEQRVRAGGMRMTVSRRLVYAAVSRSPRPLSHAELVRALGEHGLDPTTIFRNLKALIALGLVFRVRMRDPVWRYGPSVDGDSAQPSGASVALWLHCRRCDGVERLPPDSVVLPEQEGTVVEEVYLLGRCSECSSAESQATRSAIDLGPPRTE